MNNSGYVSAPDELLNQGIITQEDFEAKKETAIRLVTNSEPSHPSLKAMDGTSRQFNQTGLSFFCFNLISVSELHKEFHNHN